MKLSIIIPIHNEEPFLRRCLDSVKKQILDDVEVILVEDHSTDASLDIALEYREEGFRVFVNMDDAGVSNARNLGLDRAKGEYVTFLDADDEMTERTTETMFKYMRTQKNIIQFNSFIVNPKSDRAILRLRSHAGIYPFDRLPHKWCMVWNKMYRRDFLEYYKIRFKEGIQYGEDELFNLEAIFANGELYQAEEGTTIRHRDNKDSLSSTLNVQKLNAQYEALTHMMRKCMNESHKRELQKLIDEHIHSRTYKDNGFVFYEVQDETA